MLDGKSYQLLQLTIDLYDALKKEADRLGVQINVSAIDRVVREAEALIITPIQLTRVNRDDVPTESYQNPAKSPLFVKSGPFIENYS